MPLSPSSLKYDQRLVHVIFTFFFVEQLFFKGLFKGECRDVWRDAIRIKFISVSHDRVAYIFQFFWRMLLQKRKIRRSLRETGIVSFA